ncbi:MAG: hypothetical protein A3B81_05840 [Candidatus Muproteobacteria bacterium RIFCSPHIGHO2_02_FULL_65_16]|uniref:DUF4254 domain-containing protein n=1 Tax=Candidatus Muproteobacteria bacterium RIFCSPHIGHO2_02_FULL_65_16 TaxID=1817766 RepID=A0A1F6TW66_9PROT|nr:MAG: hypothetical protein A3B81_05840 [Candidatus Muproteobacteria bacterium RIFCSPHIGHO2_02_FULL_65_16]
MFSDVTASKISEFHDACVNTTGWADSAPPRFTEGAWKHIELNHRFNSLLWGEEDQARRRDVADSEIAANKRAIDRYNQQRQNAIESIDESLLQRLVEVKPSADARQNSETAGSIVDRLSILSLKIYHMRQQTLRTDVDRTHIEACRRKLNVLMEQRADLQQCLDALLRDAVAGRAYFKVYRQFKMYNDPTLNPYLYGKK